MPLRALMLVMLVILSIAPAPTAQAQTDGATLYKRHCEQCHDNPQVRAPDRDAMKLKTRDEIFASLVSGVMAPNAKDMTAAERRIVADYLGAPAGTTAGANMPETALCRSSGASLADPLAGPRWIGWGNDLDNSRFQPARAAGLKPDEVPRLKLKWAFGFPGSTVAYAQPAVAGGRVFVGSDKGVVYSLDAKTGCAYWSFAAERGVRTAITIGRLPGSAPRHAVYFGDLTATVYALDAATGAKLWDTQVDTHPSARVTGAPTLHENRLYVPVASWEEASGGQLKYECCKFRGSVVALDAATGKIVWRAYTIAEELKPRGKNAAGTQLWGPAGGAVWSSPTIDTKRRLLYIGTGNAYTGPAANTTDAILAIELESGKLRWARQITPDDAFVIGCREGSGNCPEKLGPDFDFGCSPILRTLANGKSILVVGQKSGFAYGIDPDKAGEVIWQFKAGRGSALGGIEWGMAADSDHAYLPVSDVITPAMTPSDTAGGLFAVRLATGEKVWHTPAPPLTCTGGRGCTGAQSAAISAIPGVVFSGSVDGHFRAYSSADGTIIWDVDTAREYETVNHVKATGGSIDAAGPVIVDGMVYTTSGYGMWRGKPGNVLLAFSAQP